ncbi:hypothetical protein [Oceaniglobus roseus]|uniref:hypothetical protein n=1 Tax=Oceaniglobus roseus TaxID=1737570 RepID=UPI000C7EB7C1|nr:hypothetical protein [Kandeliimicrobium roseum]
MKSISLMAALVLGASVLTPLAAEAGMIERACLGSERKAANRALCGCIQQVADLTLDRRDQRMAARFFRDPDRAQVVRQSSSRRDEDFWKKYIQFGSTAEAYCR